MCRAVKCRNCGRTTWAGCGMHVDQVMSAVAKADRCTCDQQAAASVASGGDFLGKSTASAGGGFLGKLFGR